MTEEAARSSSAPLSRWNPYPEYSDSGIEWLGQIPAHWELRQIRHLAELVNGYPFDSALFSLDEGYPLVRIRDLDSETTQVCFDGPEAEQAVVYTGDILIGMDGDFNVARWKGSRALLNQRMCCVRSESKDLGRLLAYMLPYPLKVINDVTLSTTVKHLSSKDIARVEVPLPPQREQRAIADFLDRETAKIHALIAKKERLIELLQEKRTALISQAVTKGLDPNVPMKDSGIEWLGRIPAHWRAKRVKFLAWFNYGDSLAADAREEGDIPVYGSNGPVGTHSHANALGPCIVIGRKGSFGKVSYSDVPCFAIDTTFYVDRSTAAADVRWLYYALPLLGLDALSQDAAVPGLSRERAHDEWLPDIPTEEQRVIADFLDRKTAEIDALVTKVHQATARLGEYRTALISAAVTGKIDVGEAAS